ncbi:MAG: vWA domain-containing protein [Candidatus Altiarchaeota archaeon]
MTTTTLASDAIANMSVNVTTTIASEMKGGPFVDIINAILNTKFQNPGLLLAIPPVLLILLLYIRRGGLSRRNINFFIVRGILVTLIITALASPILQEAKMEVVEMPTVKIILDNSPSMSIYGNKTAAFAGTLRAGLLSGLNNTEASEKVYIDVLSSEDRTTLGDELYREITTSEEGGIIVLLSDGNNNYGKNPVDVARQLGKSNTTVYAVALTPEVGDTYITEIYGDAKVTSRLDYQAEVEVKTTSSKPVAYKLSIKVDGVKMADMQVTQNTTERRIPFRFSFSDVGVHEVAAEITVVEDNNIKLNDVFLKAVEVVEKPRILLVTNKTDTPLKTVLDELYEVDMSDRTTHLENYNLVYLDDVNANSISSGTIEALREYILNGNGLAVVGGKNSYDYGNYNNSYFETLLPVLSMEKPVERRKQIAVLILIDVSGSTEYGVSDQYRKTTKIDFEKALARKILRSLDMTDSVGVIAFNTLPYVIAPLDKLGDRRTDMEEKIAKLKFSGGTEMLNSLSLSEDLLKYYAVNRYVILLSDGVIRLSSMPQVIEKARKLGTEGIKVHTVGIGFDTDEEFMKAIAQAGKGTYFKPEAYQRLNIEFGRGLEEETPGMHAIDIRDEYHFITKNINLTAQISGYNRVYEKSASQLLLATKSGNPILTVWNFGLGRVASLTTDDGMLWAGSLYTKDNSKIISSMTNWLLGDLEKNKKVRLKTRDISLGQTAAIRVDTNTKPTLTTNEGENTSIEVKTIGLNTYSAQFKPNQTGFYKITARTQEGEDQTGLAVNYPEEYSQLTPDYDQLSAIANAANGRLYHQTEQQQLKTDIIEQVKKQTTKTTNQEKPLQPYITALTLLIYFADTTIKRIKEIKRLKE